MKTFATTISFATIISVMSTPTIAADRYQDDHYYQDTARVINVDPIYRDVRISSPERECWDKPRYRNYRSSNDSYTSTIAGGIIGGVIGNQFGKGSGKTAMTVAGTLLGGSIGRDYNNNQAGYYDNGQQCHVTERYRTEQRLDGYRVTYKYNGKTYTTEMDHDPGRYIPVEVSVKPTQQNRRYY
jgi:uncharacterized protein YcfJ